MRVTVIVTLIPVDLFLDLRLSLVIFQFYFCLNSQLSFKHRSYYLFAFHHDPRWEHWLWWGIHIFSFRLIVGVNSAGNHAFCWVSRGFFSYLAFGVGDHLRRTYGWKHHFHLVIPQNRLQSKWMRCDNADRSPMLLLTEFLTAFEAVYVLLLHEVVVFKILDTLCRKQHDERFLILNIFYGNSSFYFIRFYKLHLTLHHSCKVFQTQTSFQRCMNVKKTLFVLHCLSLHPSSPLCHRHLL